MPIALVAAVVVAEAAVLLLRPASRARAGASRAREPTSAPAQLEKADGLPRGQLCSTARACWSSSACSSLLVRGAAAAARPGRAAGAGRRRRRGRRSRSRSRLAPLPVSAIARERANDVGLVTQSWGGWACDVAKSQAIGARLRGRGRRAAGRRACGASAAAGGSPGAAVVVAFGVVDHLRVARSCSTRCSTSSRRCRRGGRAPTCSSSPSGPASTSARSTGWTPRAHDGRQRVRRPASATRSASSSTTTC